MSWNRFDVSLLDYLISWMRVILFILLAISLIKPKLIKITTYYTYNFSSKFIVKFLLLVTKLSKYTVINIINSIIKKNNIPNDTEEEIEINEKDINNKEDLSK